MRWKIVTWITLLATGLSSVLIRKRQQVHTLSDYAHMPLGSLGNTLYLNLKKQRINFKANLIRHDLKHTLLGYNMHIIDEFRILAFLLGNRCYNPMAIAYLFICLPLVPEIIPKLKKDFRRGQNTPSLRRIDLQYFAFENLEVCRKRFEIKPL